MSSVPADLFSAVVTILAIILYFYMGIRVGQMRVRHNVKAPAVSGHAEFERAFRVHYNTLEALPVFLTLLWLATVYFRTIAWLPGLLGALWIVGRFLYMTGYMADPEKRGMGFGISAVAQIALLLLAAYGIVQTYIAVTA